MKLSEQQYKELLQPLVDIALAFHANELDDEARKYWGPSYQYENKANPHDIELYTGRGGKRLLTLQDCLNVLEALTK